MPSTGIPSVPQMLLAQTRLSSWPLASITVGFGLYAFFVGLSFLDGSVAWLAHGRWWNGLVFPVMTIYLLLLQPLYRRFFNDTANAFLSLLPRADRSRQLLAEALALDRRREWLAFGLGAALGWLLSRPWRLPGPWLMLYGFIGGGLMFGLLGWSVYSTLTGTKFLSTLHHRTQSLGVLKPGPFGPFTRWSIGAGLAFLGGGALSVIFTQPKDLLAPGNVILYSTLLLVVVLVLSLSGAPASLLSRFRVIRAFVLLVFVAIAGTIGYNRLEGWDLLDGLYMTVITMTTIGYGETGPLSENGRVFTIVLGLVSVGIAGYAISTVAALLVEGDLNRIIRRHKMDKQIAKLNEHIILCGAGRVGTQIALEFYQTQTPFVLVDQDPEAIEEMLRVGHIPYLQGNATKNETLRLAGIERAKGLVAALRDDKDNAFVVLSARSLNPNLRIAVRLNEEENIEKLRQVGADEIVLPDVIGGLRLASVMIRPSVVAFLDEMLRVTGQTLRMEEIRISDDSTLAGKTLVEADIARRTGLLVVAIKWGDGGYQFNPRGQTVLKSGDILIVIGTPEKLVALKRLESA